LIDWFSHTRFQQLRRPLCRRAQSRACRRRVLELTSAPHFTMLPWPATLSTALGLASIHVYVHIRIKKCLACLFSLSSSLVAASAVHLVSMYLQSPPDTALPSPTPCYLWKFQARWLRPNPAS
jgi:hypothetical protein